MQINLIQNQKMKGLGPEIHILKKIIIIKILQEEEIKKNMNMIIQINIMKLKE